MQRKNWKYMLLTGGIAGITAAALLAGAVATNVPYGPAMAAVTATPVSSSSAASSAGTPASPAASASASASAVPSTEPTQEPAMSVMNAPVEQKITKKGLIYEYTATYAHLIGCTSAAKQKKSITIPAKICVQDIYYDVTMIDCEAFKGCKKLRELQIGKYVKQIRYGAFQGDSKLRRVTFRGSRLNNVGDAAFRGTFARLRFVMPKAVKDKYQKLLKTASPKKAVYQGE